MTEYDPAVKQAVYDHLDRLTSKYRALEDSQERVREELRAAIVKYLGERAAPPGELSDHTPYDRNHVGRIARDGGVEPTRKPTVRSIKPQRRKA